jgi:transcriptional regulator with XRE-family HTH domain
MSQQGARQRRTPISETHRKLGEALRQLRLNSGLTQSRVAEGVYHHSYLSSVENGCAIPSIKVIDLYIARCGGTDGQRKNLANLLDDIRNATYETKFARHAAEKGIDSATLKAIERRDLLEPEDLYTLDMIEMHVSCNDRRLPQEVRSLVKIRAKVEGADRYYFRASYNEDLRPGVLTPVPGSGCSMGAYTESKRGVLNGYFRLDRQLSPNDPEPYVFSHRMLYNTERRVEWPILITPKTDMDRIAIHVQFTPPAVPNRVWWFDLTDAWDVWLDQPDSNALPVDSGGYYFRDWSNPLSNRSYGMLAEWEL